MNIESSTLGSLLGAHLVKILEAHGVQANRNDAEVHVGGDQALWVRLSAERESSASPVRLHVDAAGPDGSILSDSLNGFGEELAGVYDALQHFCINDFHVLLAGLWGLLEEDQVDHYTVTTDNGPWDLYLGAWVSRMTDPNTPLPAPEVTFRQALIDAAPRLLAERKPRAGRVFVAALNGELTYEAMFDMEPSDELEAVLRSVPLTPPATGYASQRLFFLALPQRGGHAHARVGRCTPTRDEEAPAPSRAGRLAVGLGVAAVLIAILYLWLR